MLENVQSIDFYICSDSKNYESLFTINNSAIQNALKKNQTYMVVVNNILESVRKLVDLSKVSYRLKITITGGGLISDKHNLKSEQVKNYLKLTIREKELLKLLSEKYKTLEIISMMKISLNTYKTHKKNLYAKMKFNDRDDLLDWAKNCPELLG